MVKSKKVDAMVQWGVNLVAIRIFGTVKHWPATSMQGIHANEPPEKGRLVIGLKAEGKFAFK